MCSLLAPNSTVTDCELHSITIMVDITVCEWSFLEACCETHDNNKQLPRHVQWRGCCDELCVIRVSVLFAVYIQKVGCDGILGSRNVENKCLQCVDPSQGNANCSKYSGVYTSNAPLTGNESTFSSFLIPHACVVTGCQLWCGFMLPTAAEASLCYRKMK